MAQLPSGSTIGGQQATHLGNLQTHLTSINVLSNITTELNTAIVSHVSGSSHIQYGAATGINTKTVTLNAAPSSLIEGLGVAFKNVTENTGAVILNVNGLGGKSILNQSNKALEAGDLKAGAIYTVRYNGTNYILQSGSSGMSKTDLSNTILSTNSILGS